MLTSFMTFVPNYTALSALWKESSDGVDGISGSNFDRTPELGQYHFVYIIV